MTETQARDEICRVGKSLFDRGYVHASAGNISVKLDAEQGGGYLITPTDACLGFLDPARLARLDDAGQQISGDRASNTIALHRQIYAASADSPAAAYGYARRAGRNCKTVAFDSTSCVFLADSNIDGLRQTFGAFW